MRTKLSSTESSISESEAVRRRAVAVAKLKEMEAAKREGQLVDVDEVEREWATIATTTRDQILSLPSRIINRLPSEIRREVWAVANEEVRAALTSLSAEIRGTAKATP